MRLRVLRFQPTATPPQADPTPRDPRPTPPWRKLLRLPRPRNLREGLRQNTGLKLISLVLAFIIWFSINVSERDAERVVEIQVVPRHAPADLIVTNAPAKPVAVTVRGPRTILEGIDEQKERLVLDLANVTASDTRLDYNADMVHPELPRRLKVVRFEPARLKLKVERRARRRVPVRVALDGTAAVGYTFGDPQVTPQDVEVTGPGSKVDELKEITTEPINVSGASESLTRTTALTWAGDFMSFSPDRVTVNIPLKEVFVSRPFEDVPINIRNAGGLEARVSPPRIDLMVHGPQRLLNNYKLDDGKAYVDAGGLAPGSYRLAVQVDLPPDVEVTRRKPDVVTLVVVSAGAR